MSKNKETEEQTTETKADQTVVDTVAPVKAAAPPTPVPPKPAPKAEPKPKAPPEDGVTLGGKTYKILHKTNVKQLKEDYLRRLVDENHTVVVIEKYGD